VANRTLKTYRTRIDQFRVREGIDVARWFTEAGITRSFFHRIRSGHDFSIDTLLRLVRSARRITGKDVRASDLADIGEDALPAATGAVRTRRPPRPPRYDTALERWIASRGLTPAEIAREARISSPTLLKMRQGRITKNGAVVIGTSTLAAVVRALRSLTGEAVRAADISGIEELRSN
jgi:predicted transcriptional regulator